MILNLDPLFQPFGAQNLIQFDSFTFSGGEPHIKILSVIKPNESVLITTRINSFNDLGLLMLAVDALKRLDVNIIQLFMPYMPGARQDRVMVSGEPLSVKVYANLINELEFDSVTIFDPHSDVSPALINNCKVLTNHEFIRLVIENISSEVVLIAPDGGALKKIYKVSEYLGGLKVVECSKKRNVKTGQLDGFKVYEEDLLEKPCLIVDDICDGGGTFIGLAKALKAKNAGQLFLAVSHGIFSKGLNELKQHFVEIYTTDSIKDINDNTVKQIKFKEFNK